MGVTDLEVHERLPIWLSLFQWVLDFAAFISSCAMGAYFYWNVWDDKADDYKPPDWFPRKTDTKPLKILTVWAWLYVAWTAFFWFFSSSVAWQMFMICPKLSEEEKRISTKKVKKTLARPIKNLNDKVMESIKRQSTKHSSKSKSISPNRSLKKVKTVTSNESAEVAGQVKPKKEDGVTPGGFYPSEF